MKSARPAHRRPRDPLVWLRRTCLALPETVEVEAWGHPNFKTGGRAFATFEIWKGRPSIAIATDPEEQAMLTERFGFFRTPYAGARGWVSAWMDEPAPLRLMADMLRQAHRRAVAGPRKRAAKPRPRKSAGRRG